MITGNIGTVNAGLLASDECGCIPCPVEDLHICGQYTIIDGTGKSDFIPFCG